MIVYRLGRAQYSTDLVGEGARRFGGRWNNIGTQCLYTSASRALAVLEYTVNVNIDDIPRVLSFTIIEIPDIIQELKISELPEDWNQSPAPSSTKNYGSELLIKADAPIIKIPSIIIPQEFNYILNPIHVESKNFKILDLEDFIYDIRIKMS